MKRLLDWLRIQAESVLAQVDAQMAKHNYMVQQQEDYLATLKQQGVDQKLLDKITYIYRSPDLRFYAWGEDGMIPLGENWGAAIEPECCFKTGMLSIDRLCETIALILSQREGNNANNNG